MTTTDVFGGRHDVFGKPMVTGWAMMSLLLSVGSYGSARGGVGEYRSGFQPPIGSFIYILLLPQLGLVRIEAGQAIAFFNEEEQDNRV